MASLKYWMYLTGSIALEVMGTGLMKLSQSPDFLLGPAQGMTLMYLCLGGAYYLLSRAVLRLPVGVAYAFWEGFGLLLIAGLSVLFLGEELGPLRLLSLTMIMSGVVLINRGTHSQAAAEEASPNAANGGSGEGISRIALDGTSLRTGGV